MVHIDGLKKSRFAGFTLLELLVVVAIIGFLSSVSIVALSASKAKSRDTQRKLDQITIIKAVELYTNDFGAPPAQLCRDEDANNQCDPVALMSRPESPLSTSSLASLVDVSVAYAAVLPGGPGPGGGCQATTNSCLRCEHFVPWSPLNPCSGRCVPDDYCPPLEGGVGDNVCGNNVCESGEADEAAPTYCALDCGCNSNGACEGGRGENISNCPADCSVPVWDNGGSGGASGSCDSDGICDAGETPGTCSQDCNDYSVCYVSGEWDLCCLFGGTYCSPSGASTGVSGYYGVCNVDRCEQKYLLQAPSFTCDSDDDCAPSAAAGVATEEKFVANAHTNWLRGLEPYVVSLPKDPGGNKPPEYSIYYASSHPDIVGRHRFCVWVSLERTSDNFNPYNDLTETPTGALDPLWTPLCVQ